MTWKTELNDDAGTVRVSCSGDLSMDDMTMLAIETSFLAQENSCRKILLDMAQARLTFPVEGLGVLLDSYAECGIPVSTGSGLLLGGTDAGKDFSKFRKVAEEYGYRIEFLSDGRQADLWLADAG